MFADTRILTYNNKSHKQCRHQVESWNGLDNIYHDGSMPHAAVKKIKEYTKQPKPFFLAVGFFKPLLPFITQKKYRDLYDIESIKLAPNQLFPNSSSRSQISFQIPVNYGIILAYLGLVQLANRSSVN